MIYMFLANGFEEIEALCPLDLMRRAGLEVTTVGIGSEYITGAHSITVKADVTDAQYCDSTPTLIFLPGGMPATLGLAASETVRCAIEDALRADAYICAICAAPSILGDMGLLRGKNAICYPGFEDRLTGATVSDKKVVVDGRIITAKAMGASVELGLKIVELLCGADASSELKSAIAAD